MSANLTRLILMYREPILRRELLFGCPVLEREIGGPFSERHLFFAPGQLFAVESWEANDFGTLRWFIAVLRAVAPGERAVVVPGVSPGAELLLAARGKKRVREVRAWLRKLKEQRIDPESLHHDYYRSAHFAIQARLAPRNPLVPNGKVNRQVKGNAP